MPVPQIGLSDPSQHSPSCLNSTWTKVGFVALGVLFGGGAVTCYLLQINAIATYTLAGTGGFVILGTAITSLIHACRKRSSSRATVRFQKAPTGKPVLFPDLQELLCNQKSKLPNLNDALTEDQQKNGAYTQNFGWGRGTDSPPEDRGFRTRTLQLYSRPVNPSFVRIGVSDDHLCVFVLHHGNRGGQYSHTTIPEDVQVIKSTECSWKPSEESSGGYLEIKYKFN